MHPLVEEVLKRRGIHDHEAFLNPSYHERPNPFLMRDMDRAVGRILRAIQDKETIAVWHDYDCDGIPGGALLSDFFNSIGYPILTYVPDRSEGYGLNTAGLQSLRQEGASLVITVDCGITDADEVSYAHELGLDVIITDHHLPPKVLPGAIAVINPHRSDCEYPFKELCGTGVAFKLAEALLERGNFSIPPGYEKWLLDLVALATVADMVPLIGENRILTHFGLLVLRKGKRPGLRAIFEHDRIPLHAVVEDDLAFSVAPKINASSRMAHPKKAFELLTTRSADRARALAKELTTLNQARKIEGMRIAKEVKRRIDAFPSIGEVIVVGDRSWRPSLLGIAATSVVETYGKTVFLWGQDGPLIKGSCRSNGEVNMVEVMRSAHNVFADFGGHEFSGGFSLREEVLHVFAETIETSFQSIERAGESKRVRGRELPDVSLHLAEMNESAYEALRTLAPFGEGNPKPVFRIAGVRVLKLFRFGAHKEHAKAVIADDVGNTHEAISFFIGRAPFRDVFELLSPGDRVTLDASLERSFFGGKKSLRLRIESLVAG